MLSEGLYAGDLVSLVGDAGDSEVREVKGLRLTPFSLPRGCIGGYYPEMNPLIPLWYHDKESKTPASKGVPVRIRVQQRVANAVSAEELQPASSS